MTVRKLAGTKDKPSAVVAPPPSALPVTCAPPVPLLADGTADLQAQLENAIEPALLLLPAEMTCDEARVMLLAIGLQESQYLVRAQYGGGPARGFHQFEPGTEQSRGGVYGIYLHEASRGPLEVVCAARCVAFEPEAIYNALELDDILAAACARLLLWTDAYSLPPLGAEGSAWELYERTWRPGKPHPDTWPANYREALEAVTSGWM